MKTVTWIALILVVVGGINWALVGLFDFNVITTITGQMTTISRVVYTLVGVAAVYLIILFPKHYLKTT